MSGVTFKLTSRVKPFSFCGLSSNSAPEIHGMVAIRRNDLVFWIARETSMANSEKLGQAVKLHGYAKKKKIKLYGKQLELVSDPVNRQDDEVFVEAREEGTNQVKEVQVPRNVVQMAKGARRKESQ